MHIHKSNIPVRLDVEGATASQAMEFGDASGYGMMSGERFSLAAGTDIAPLLVGLEGDLCQTPHWGHLVSGEVVVTYGDGSTERVIGGEIFYWPPGHSVRVESDAELIMFSPQTEHSKVIAHMKQKLGG